MDTPIQVDLGRIAQDLQIRRIQVESVVQLLDEGNTVPFITRYRKERTGGLDERVIREIQLRVGRQRELAERKETVLKSIEQQGKLSDELREAILSADSPKRLEDLYLPFKPKKKTKASEARAKGLEPLALRIWNRDESLTDLPAAAAEFVNPEKGVESVEQALEGVGHILAESISELAPVRDAIRRVVWRTGKLVTTKAETVGEGQGLDFRDYFDYSEPANHVPPHRVLAINRGEKEGVLRIRLELPRQEVERALFSQLPLEGHPHQEFFTNAALDALDRLLLPSLEREVKRDLTDVAEKHAVDVFARNLRSLLLQPPITRQNVLAIDPGFRTGCKVAVLDPFGAILEHDVIHPHQPQNRKHEAKLKLKDLIGKHKVDVVAIGNGTACRETEELVAEIIAEGTFFDQHPGVTEYPGRGGAKAAAPATAEEAPPAPAVPETPTDATTTAAPAEASAESPTEAPPQDEPAPDPQHTTPQAQTDAAPSPEGTTGEAPSPEGTSEGPSREAPPQDEPALDPAQTTPQVQTDEAAGSNSGESEDPIETMPPIQGGAPDESERQDGQEPPPQEQSTGETPIETTPPPPSSTPEAESAEAEAQKADQLEKSDQTENPADFGEDPGASAAETPPSSSDEGAPASTETVKTDTETGSAGVSAPVEPAPPTAEDAVEPATAQDPEPPASPPDEAGPSAAGPEAQTSGEGGPPDVVSEATPSDATGELPAAGEAGRATPEQSGVAPAQDFTHLPVGPKPKPPAEKPPKPSRSRQPPPPPRPHPADALLARLSYVVVNEAGASVYSASPVGREEFPDLDATTRGTISIGRRLQDPLSELVQIEPQNIGVGLYQHDVNPKQLKESLETVIESCVNFVGVDLNSASVPLLRHVSGLNALTARRLADRRKEHGPFTSREQIREIEGIGDKIFTQAAGFLKVRDGEHPLDRTWVHPESYEAATKLLENFGYAPSDLLDRDKLAELNARLAEADVPALARELNVGEPTLHDICEALARPDRDPREDLPKPIFKRGVLKLEDLTPGMELKGTVLNVVDFGAFVDIGLKDSGLVHISQLANRYVKSPHDVVSVGDVVTVWVLGVDPERKRVSLTMVQPGTERPRGPRRGEGQEGSGPPRGEGGRRGGPRPRREGGPGGRTAPSQQGRDEGQPAPVRNARIPGPPQRAQQGRRGGPRRQGAGARLGGRNERPEPSDRPAPSPKPRTPPPPAAPLSSEAIAGQAPLRTFGQLKQLFEMRTKGEEGAQDEGATEVSPQQEPAPDPQHTTPQGRTEAGAQDLEAPASVQEARPTPQESQPASGEATPNGDTGPEGQEHRPAGEGSAAQGDPGAGQAGG